MRTVRLAARWRNRPRIGLAWFFVVVLSGLIALCTRAAADPIDDEESSDVRTSIAPGDGPAEPRTSLDVLELDPLAALDLSRLRSTDELEILTPTLGARELGELAGEEIAAAPPPSRWGRIDLGLAWRRHVIATSLPRVDDQLWLVVTWRR